MRAHTTKMPKILVLYTGGTIGMVKNKDGVYIPSPNTFHRKIKSFPEMHDEYLAKKLGFQEIPDDQFIMPHINPKCTAIQYMIKEYDPLLDSSNMSVDDWIRIANDIRDSYNDYDAFVVLHGTDTLAYTASALSFMLEGLEKNVVITGSQIPIFEPRSDAKDNFLSSLIFAGCFNIPEVCVCFANYLMRGNRTVKKSSNHLDAFCSPNHHILGKAGIHFKIHDEYVIKNDVDVPLNVNSNLNPNVGILSLFPTVTAKMVSAFLNLHHVPIEGVVLLSYGIGNIPSNNKELMNVFKSAISQGVLIVNVTQCSEGTVSATYETGKVLESIGIIPGFDMTAEAALAKLSFVLGLEKLNLDEKKEMMIANLRGELTNRYPQHY